MVKPGLKEVFIPMVDEYVDRVTERAISRDQSQGGNFSCIDFVMGASVIFDLMGTMGAMPATWAINPMRGRDPITLPDRDVQTTIKYRIIIDDIVRRGGTIVFFVNRNYDSFERSQFIEQKILDSVTVNNNYFYPGENAEVEYWEIKESDHQFFIAEELIK